jgi:hypothetical protein
MSESSVRIRQEIQARIRAAWAESGIIPYAELRKRYPERKAEIDEAVLDFVTDEMEEWPEGDLDFDDVMDQIADHAFLGEEPPTWTRKSAAVDRPRFRRKG